MSTCPELVLSNCVDACETETTVWPAYGEAAMLGSLFIVEAFSDAGNEVGDVAPDTDDPEDALVLGIFGLRFLV